MAGDAKNIQMNEFRVWHLQMGKVISQFTTSMMKD